MSIIFIRIIWSVWFAICAYTILMSISSIVFAVSNKRRWRALKQLPNNIVIAVLWPFMLLSRGGRSRLEKATTWRQL